MELRRGGPSCWSGGPRAGHRWDCGLARSGAAVTGSLVSPPCPSDTQMQAWDRPEGRAAPDLGPLGGGGLLLGPQPAPRQLRASAAAETCPEAKACPARQPGRKAPGPKLPPGGWAWPRPVWLPPHALAPGSPPLPIPHAGGGGGSEAQDAQQGLSTCHDLMPVAVGRWPRVRHHHGPQGGPRPCSVQDRQSLSPGAHDLGTGPEASHLGRV